MMLKMQVRSSFLLALFSFIVFVKAQTEGDIQLVGSEFGGRVEVFIGGQYGTVCFASTFGKTEADVICRQQGFVGAESWGTAITLNYERASSGTPIHFSSLRCSSAADAQHIFSCSNGTTTCTHVNDAAVNCYPARIDASPYQMQVRLVDGDHRSEGRVEVYCNGQWGTICNAAFTNDTADTVCRTLGYTSGYIQRNHLMLPGNDSQPIWFSSPLCSESTYCLPNCSNQCPPVSTESCNHSSDATVQCGVQGQQLKVASIRSCVAVFDNAPSGGTGAVRFYRNGQVSHLFNSGIVQVYRTNQWGNICHDRTNPDIREDTADAVCRHLGYTASSARGLASNGTLFGYDYRQTLMNSIINCRQEINLFQCSWIPIESAPLPCTDDTDDAVVICYTIRIWDSPFLGMVRLQAGDFVSEGRIEVYCNGQWGTVCNEGFDLVDANVFCVQLGYTRAVSFNNTLPGNSSSQPIWLSNLQCTATRCIGNCQRCPNIANDTCTHQQDINIICTYDRSSQATVSDLQSCTNIHDEVQRSNGVIRLVRNGQSSSSFTSGIIEVYHSQEWINVCDDTLYDTEEANVACRQLGYTGASSFGRADSGKMFGLDFHETGIDRLNCFSNRESIVLLQCPFSTSILVGAFCASDRLDATVTCFSTRIWNNPFSGMLRLTGGEVVAKGRVEVYCNNQWGTICSDNFDMTEADTVCRQLGYNVAVTFNTIQSTANETANDSIPIWLEDVDCMNSVRSCISSCQKCPLVENTTCSHSEDIYVQCTFVSPTSVIRDTCNNETTTTLSTTSVFSSSSMSSTVGSSSGSASPSISPSSTPDDENNSTDPFDIFFSRQLGPLTVFEWTLYVLVPIIAITINCCSGFCYALSKNNCSCDDPGGFCIDWILGSVLCCLWFLYHCLCANNKRRRNEAFEMS